MASPFRNHHHHHHHHHHLLLLLAPFCLLLPPAAPQQDYSIAEVEGEEVEHVRVVVGYNASLPCDVRAPDHDQPTLTLWYIADEEAPVYSYDERPAVRGSQWSDAGVLGSRAHYHPHRTPPALHLTHATQEDARLYRCRVDFKNTRSRVTWVNLTVIVPPTRAEVIPRVTPVMLGDKNDVICKAYGGSPPPEVIWLQGSRQVDSSYTVAEGETYNVLEVAATRADLTSPYTCRAANNDLLGPGEVTYLRNVTCAPLSVTIEGGELPVTEERPANLTCTVIGSNPPAVVTWLQQGKALTPLHTVVSHQDNVTKSVLSMNATRQDHKRQLVCRASNPLVRGGTLEDIYTLNVQYKPNLHLVLGRSLSQDNLQESKDLFFECQIEANPQPYKVEWWHDGHLLIHNVSGGVIVSQSTLALQKVRRERSGEYQCSASNVEGDAKSDPMHISIKYAPRCTVAPSLRGAPLREPLNLTCRVDADPPDVTFTWTFNNSVRRDKVFSDSRYSSERLESVLRYTPASERDYGTLLCYARNSVGNQEVPCSFTVVSAGPPEEVTGCGVDNITSHSVTLTCAPGFNGGLPQLFLLQVWTAYDLPGPPQLVANMTRATAEFLVRSLEAGQQYRGQVTAFNRRGAADPVQVMIFTLKEAEMHKSLPSRSEPSAIMLVLAVIGGALLVVMTCLLVGVWGVRGCRRGGMLGDARDDDGDEDATTRVLVKESNPDILEAAPPHQATTPTTHTPITISVIQTPTQLPPHRPQSYQPPPTAPTSPETPLGALRVMGDRRVCTLPTPKSSFGLSEPLHRPIEESLQRSLRGLSSQHLA